MATKRIPGKTALRATAKKAVKAVSAKKASASDAVDAQLKRYREMRDFGLTAEPSGGRKTKAAAKAEGSFPFVIQKHAASHLHYDFRFGWNGVLKSWAVAKGPSYNVKDRRLAVQVEDHPMEYGGFEGTIPRGQYGGGTVMVWDQGTWRPQAGHEDVDAGLRDGSLKFEMFGSKVKGRWTLVRMGGKAANESKPNWLLIKEHDEFEREPDDQCVTEAEPDSAVTGRSLEQIAAQEDHVWNSKETKTAGQAWVRKDEARVAAMPAKNTLGKARTAPPALRQGKKETQPEFVAPELAMEATEPPSGAEWLHELKLDGYRIQARKSGNEVKLLTRKGLDWTHRMPAVADAMRRVTSKSATLDGEVVVLGADGNSNFANLQAAFQHDEKHPLTYFVFDLLHLDGKNTREMGLRERKELLTGILPEGDETLRLSEHLETDGGVMFQHACALHAEGIISKHAKATYRSGRGRDWLKSKCLREQEFVVGGFTNSTEGTDRVGSLLLGYYDNGKFMYAGRTGTGFTQKLKRELRLRLGEIEVKTAAFAKVPQAARRGAVWVKPELVAQVRFATWTADDLVRQAAFLGLREDKPATEVLREGATVAPTPKRHAATGKVLSHKAADVKIAAKTASLPSEAKAGSAAAVPVRLTHPDKVLDPESGLTKRQLAEYYWAVAEHMLPHVSGRPLSLVRCPEGAGKPCFFQKHVNAMLPPGIGSVDVPDKKTGKVEEYITLNTKEALAGLAQMGVLEVHPWGSKGDDLERPDRLIFDLDPDEAIEWETLAATAVEVRKRLKKAGLESFLKLTGGKGLHVVVPMEPDLGWTEIKELAHNFVRGMERTNPALYLTKMSKAARKGKIYLDYLRNERGATAVAVYSPRARMGAHVSLPLPWTALKETKLPLYSVHDFEEWRSRLKSDPWKVMVSLQQRVDAKRFDVL